MRVLPTLSIAVLVSLAACGGDSDEALRYDDIGRFSADGDELTEVLVEFYFSGEKPGPGDEVSVRDFARFRAAIDLYDNLAIRSALVDSALAKEENSTRPLMEGIGFNEPFIDAFFDDLRAGADDLPVARSEERRVGKECLL